MEWFEGWLDWLLYYPLWFVDIVMQAAARFVASIPSPQFLAELPGLLDQVPPDVIWLADVLELGPGLSVVLGAYVLRFVIRRIPFFG